MCIYQKKLASFVIIATFFLCSGFSFGSLGGTLGAKTPQATIAKIINAIEENNDKAFLEAIDYRYWMLLDNPVTQKKIQAEKLTMMQLAQKENLDEFVAAMYARIFENRLIVKDKKRRDIILNRFNSIRSDIKDGSYANKMRVANDLKRPFVPQWLKTAVYKQKDDGIASATVTLPDGLKTALGMVETDLGWIVASTGGNAKAAEDKARVAKEAIIASIEAEKRRVAFQKIFSSTIDQFITFVKNKDKQAIGEQFVSLTTVYDCIENQGTLNIKKYFPIKNTDIKLDDAKELWQDAATILASNHDAIWNKKIKPRELAGMLKNSMNVEELNKIIYPTFRNGELIWQKDNIYLALLHINAGSANHSVKGYWLFKVQNGKLQNLAMSFVGMIGKKVLKVYFPFKPTEKTKMPFKVLDYMIAFAENYPEIHDMAMKLKPQN